MSEKPVVLYVDDEPQALKYFEKTVAPEFEVLTAMNANDARSLLDQRGDEIAVLISDQRMPVETGVQLLEYTRQQYPRIVRLLTTAYSDIGSAIQAVNTGGIYWYINKPWQEGELQAVLRRAVEYYSLHRDRDHLMRSKMNVLQHILIADRAKGLVLLASSIGKNGWQNWLESLNAYLSTAKTIESLSWNPEDIMALDICDVAKRECSFLLKSYEQIESSLGSIDQENAKLDLTTVMSNVAVSISKQEGFEDVKLKTQLNENEVFGSAAILQRLFEHIIRRMANMDGASLEVSVSSKPITDSIVSVEFTPIDRVWSNSQMASLFSAAIPSLSGLMGLDMDIFVAYLLAGHLGGQINVIATQTNNPVIAVQLPRKPVAKGPQLTSQDGLNKIYERLHEWVEHLTSSLEQ